MTPTTLQAIFAPAAWLCAALLCLLLEAAGTPVGARKRGARTHLPWIIILVGAVIVAHSVVAWPGALHPGSSGAGLLFDRPGLLTSALLAVLVVASHTAAVPGLRAMDEERGESSAAFAVVGAGLSLIAVADDILILGAGVVLVTTALALVAAPDRDGPHGIEAATKGVIGNGLILVLLSVATVFAWAAMGTASFAALGDALSSSPELGITAVVLVVVVLALLIGAVPLHQSFVDLVHGASAAASSLLAGGALLAAGTALLRFSDGLASAGAHAPIANAYAWIAGLTLIGAPIAALDQTRIGRMVAYLAAVPGGLLFAAAAAMLLEPASAVHAWRAATEAALAGALGAAAALLGVVIPKLDAAATWEDWAGFGRKRPVMAALLVYALGTAAGLPGTLGFDARLDVSRVCIDNHFEILGLIVIASVAAGAAPLVRLALFLFAKDPPPRQRLMKEEPTGPMLVVTFALLVGVAALLAVWPGLVDLLVASARP